MKSLILILLSSLILHPSSFAAAPTAGSGAHDLIAPTNPRIVTSTPGVPSLPSLPSLPSIASLPSIHDVPEPTTNTFYFAATTSDTNGLFSDYSNEVVWCTTNDHPTITLAWDPPLSNDPRYTYQLHTGGSSRTYTNTTSAGTNRTLHLTLYTPEPPPLTNRLIQVTTVNATNLQWSVSPCGPWTVLNRTNWTATNPPAARYFRPLGRSKSLPGQSAIKQTLF